jgi:hypothetical protein
MIFKNSPKTPRSKAFQTAFGTERQCRRFLFRQKWPKGFECPICHYRRALERDGGRKWVCGGRGCPYWESPTKGTIAESIKKPLRIWFWGIWLYAQARGGMTAKRLQSELDLGSYQTAWTWCQKYRHALARDLNLLTTTEGHNPLLTDGEAIADGLGRHGWSGGGKGLSRALADELDVREPSSNFMAWLLALNGCRVSSKHHHAYWAEHVFWRRFKSPRSRWSELSIRLPGPAVPYWQLIRRPGRKIPLVDASQRTSPFVSRAVSQRRSS